MNKILFISALISFNLFANEATNKQFGRVVDLKGSGFISYNGKTHEIVKGEAIEFGSEIVIEHNGQVTFVDNADHRFHLGNSSSASVSNKALLLRSGDLWVQSLNKNDNYKIETANAVVDCVAGEGILSYDSGKGKTQLMVINSMMKLSNLRTPELNLSVAEGHFSFVDNSYDEGAPRDPTPVGSKTYGQLVSLFHGVAPMDNKSVAVFTAHEKEKHEEVAKTEHPTRAIASVSAENDKMLEAYKENLLNKPEEKKVVEVKKVTKVPRKTVVVAHEKMEFHIYGQVKEPVMKTRAPASVLDQDVPKEFQESDKLIEALNKL